MLRKKPGFALMTLVFVMLVFSILAAAIVALVVVKSHTSVSNYYYEQAFYVAEAGKNYGIKYLAGQDDWTADMGFPISKTFGGGAFVIHTTDEALSSLTLYSTGTITLEGAAYTRAVRLNIERESPLGSNAFFSFGNITIKQNATIEGDVSAMEAVDMDPTCTVSGTVEQYVDLPDPENPPSLDTTYYDGEIATATAETFIPDGETYSGTITLSGTHYVNGDITFNDGADIIIEGSAIVVATGNVFVEKEVDFGENLTVIANGKVEIKKDVNIGANGLWYSSVGISLVKDEEISEGEELGEVVAGSGTVFLTPGDIDFKKNAVFNGLLFAGGSVSFDKTAHINGNVVAGAYVNGNLVAGGNINVAKDATITLNADLVDFNLVVGLSGSLVDEEAIRVIEWSEVY